jgi:uncharacterized NAD(P)/FAD-binding protein YdhS
MRADRMVVVGGGFCGAMVALHLLRDHPQFSGSLTVIEPRALLGAGLAYDTEDPQHRINVAASRMSPFVEDELHFDRWLREQGSPVGDPDSILPDGRIYARRAEVGRYVAALLQQAVAQRPNVKFCHIRERAIAARREAGGYHVALGDGSGLHADVLVLAVGHPPPALPGALRSLAGDSRLVANPWDLAALDAVPRDAAVLVVGTGLTACDVVASLRARGHAGMLHAVSRRGLLPRPRTLLPVEPFGDFATAPARTAVALLRRVRRAVAGAGAEGRPWECVIDALRRQGTEVWTALPPPEKLRFLRHLRAFWDVHRFQSAPQIADTVAAERAAGRLEVLAASLQAVTREPDGLLASLHPRGAPAASRIERLVGAIVACTGPGHTSVVETNELLHSLAEAGVLQADRYRLGIAVDTLGRCLGPKGVAQDNLFVAGPLARGTDGELMGLPQVSTQPRAVAARVAALLARTDVQSHLEVT